MDDANKAVMAAVENMVQVNEDVRLTYDALIARGLSAQDSREEIARALLGCMWEVNKGMPDRWLDVLCGLRDGRTCTQLFPDTLYDTDKGPPQ